MHAYLPQKSVSELDYKSANKADVILCTADVLVRHYMQSIWQTCCDELTFRCIPEGGYSLPKQPCPSPGPEAAQSKQVSKNMLILLKCTLQTFIWFGTQCRLMFFCAS